MVAMKRTFRNRGGLPWWYWRRRANRDARVKGVAFRPVDVSDQDALIDVGGLSYDFKTADTEWVIQRRSPTENLLRFEVQEGFRAPFDEINDRPQIRSEIGGRETLSGEIWIAFDVQLPDVSGLLASGTTMICQMKARETVDKPDPGAPIFRIDALGQGLTISTSGTATDPAPVPFLETVTRLISYPMQAGIWDRILVRLVPDPSNAELDVWRNGEQVLSLTGIPMGYVGYDYRSRFGLYADQEIGSLVSYHANMLTGADLSGLISNPPPLPSLYSLGSRDEAENPYAGWEPLTGLEGTLIKWWTADDAASLDLDAGAVTAWRDQVTGASLEQVTPAARPSLSADAFAGAPCLVFDGAGDFLNAESIFDLPSGSDACEIWAVVDQESLSTDAANRTLFAYGGTGFNFRRVQKSILSTQNRVRGQVGDGAAVLAVYSGDIFFGREIIGFRVSPSTAFCRLGYGAESSVAAVPATGTTRTRVGCSTSTTPADFWSGKVRHILVTEPLSVDQRPPFLAWLANQI